MKTLTRIMSISMLVAMPLTSSFAWDTSKNPDRYPSLGLNFDTANIDGGYGPRIDADNYLKVGESVTKTVTVQLDLRLPVTNRFTLEGRVRGISVDERFNSDYPDVIDSDIFDGSGSGFGVGLRYYFVR